MDKQKELALSRYQKSMEFRLKNGEISERIYKLKGNEIAQELYPKLGTCKKCKKVSATDRHHIDGNTWNNKRENLLFLCRRCHMTLDSRMDALQKRAHEINKKARAMAPTYCRICNKQVGIGKTHSGRCDTCRSYFTRNGTERPYGAQDGRSGQGSRHSHAKLTEQNVRDIRKSKLTGMELAKKYGVTKDNISRIRTRKIWKYVK